MKQKLISMILSLCVGLGLLAGCGNAETESKTGSSSKLEMETADSAKSKSEEKNDKEDPVHLRLVMYGEAGSRNLEFFENEFNERIKEDLNMTIEVDYLAWGESAKMEAMLAAGEEFALMIYGDQVGYMEKGYLAEIPEELMTENAPNLMNARMGLDFSSCKYQGTNYVIPVGAQVFSGPQDNIIIRNDILNQVGWDYKDIKTLEDLTEACIAVKDAFPEIEIGKFGRFPCNVEEGDTVVGKGGPESQLYFYTDYNDVDSDVIWGMYGSEEYKRELEYYYQWKELGFFDNESWLAEGDSFNLTCWEAGNALMRYGEPSRIVDHKLAGVEGADVQYLEIENNQTVMNYNYEWGWAISAEAEEYKEDLIRLIDWIYASKENYLFALYGVEGVDWKYADDGKTIESLTSDAFFYSWQHQTMYYQDSSVYAPEDWERYITQESKSINNKLIGFKFDETPVAVEKAAIAGVVSEYENRYMYDNYDEWAEAVLPKLEEAGYQKYLDEVQKQVSEWWAENH